MKIVVISSLPYKNCFFNSMASLINPTFMHLLTGVPLHVMWPPLCWIQSTQVQQHNDDYAGIVLMLASFLMYFDQSSHTTNKRLQRHIKYVLVLIFSSLYCDVYLRLTKYLVRTRIWYTFQPHASDLVYIFWYYMCFCEHRKSKSTDQTSNAHVE